MLSYNKDRLTAIIINMFRRFHDKTKPQKKTQVVSSTTYAQLSKEAPRKTKQNNGRHYSIRHKRELDASLTPVRLQCIKTQRFLYQGLMRGNTQHGDGILLIKNGTTICGTWNNGALNGRALLFPPFGGKILANFNNGKLNGWMLAFYGQHILRLEGERLTFDRKEQMWVASRCTPQGKVVSIIHAEKGSKNELPTFVSSQILRDMFNSFVVLKENFLESQLLDQFQITLTTSYIGFVDEERKPCGLGCTYSDQELYCGNFFEGVLQHYGRMLFENGDIYQGEVMGGSFWGKGIYYSSANNQTSILVSDQHDQNVESQFQGYVLIDVVPSIGVLVGECQTGIKGEACRKAVQSLQPYYLRQFAHLRKVSNKTKSNVSDYGHSEMMDVVAQVDKQADRDEQVHSPSFSPKNKDSGDKWIQFEPEELGNTALRKTMSLKKSDIVRHKQPYFDSNKSRQEMGSFNVKDGKDGGQSLQNTPNQGRTMTQIPFGKAFNTKSGEKQAAMNQNGNIKSEERRVKEREWNDRIEQKEMSSMDSQISGGSKKLAKLMDNKRTNRKNIF